GDNVQYASTAASTATIAAGMILNSEELAEAVLTLVNGDAKPITKQINPGSGFNSSPVPMAFVLFASPATVRDLSKDSNWIGVAEYGSHEKLGPWEVGTILAAGYAVRVITTGSDASTESSTVTVHKSVLIGQYAYAMVEIDELSVEMIHQPATDPLKQRESFGWKLATVFKRQAEYAIVRIEHAVS
ncbi:MAG TPA: N4-gp56 family major capsid protein, partial [Acidobacteriota bacterium]|nr:N4-gp56 family major capsid protein [Acidobacteriota bacterium]